MLKTLLITLFFLGLITYISSSMLPLLLTLLTLALCKYHISQLRQHRWKTPSRTPFGSPRNPKIPSIKDTFKFDKLPEGTCTVIPSDQLQEHTPEGLCHHLVNVTPNELDCIVVGSGIGGLTAAASLAKFNWRVLVLEQHDVAGGATHSFEEHGCEFDTGVHYLGSMRSLKPYLDAFLPELEWDCLNEAPFSNGFYNIAVVNKDKGLNEGFGYVPTRAAFEKKLSELYPKSAKQISKYFDIIENVSKSSMSRLVFILKAVKPKWVGRLLFKLLVKYHKYGWVFTKSVDQVMREMIDDVEVRNILTVEFGDYSAKNTDNAPFFMQILVFNHYLRGGAYFPRGGSVKFAQGFTKTIEDHGGRVLVQAMVERIVVDSKNRVQGVLVRQNLDSKKNELAFIRSKNVVSGAGLSATIKLLTKPPIEWGKLKPTPSGSMFYVFVALNGTAEELKLPAYNVWSTPWKSGQSHKDGMDEFITDPIGKRPPCFISFPAAKDTNYSIRNTNGRCTAEILSLTPYDLFEKWDGTTLKKRGDDYKDYKKIWEDKLLKELFYYFPHLEDKVYKVTSASPLTIQYYYEAAQGQVYGLDMDMNRFTPEYFTNITPETSINGLYLTGQDLITCGVSAGLMSGAITAMSMLNYTYFPFGDLWRGKDMIKDWNVKKKDV